MAAKRMFSIDVVDTDKFLDMPVSTQALYFHFGMRADDDGFVASPRKIVKIANCTNDDLKVLISKGYVIPFQSGVIVITDWKTNNFIRSDRYKATKYQEEFEQLELCNGAYSKKDVYKMDTKCMQAVSDMDTKRIPNGYQMDTQISIDKNRLDKSSIDNISVCAQAELDNTQTYTKKPKTTRFVPPTVEEVKQYCEENNYKLDAQRFVDFYESKGWMIGKNKMKSWQAAVRTWVRKAQEGSKQDEEDRGESTSVRLW